MLTEPWLDVTGAKEGHSRDCIAPCAVFSHLPTTAAEGPVPVSGPGPAQGLLLTVLVEGGLEVGGHALSVTALEAVAGRK